jgi:hypothetical protein
MPSLILDLPRRRWPSRSPPRPERDWRDGSGTRVLARIVRDAGMFIGDELDLGERDRVPARRRGDGGS